MIILKQALLRWQISLMATIIFSNTRQNNGAKSKLVLHISQMGTLLLQKYLHV